MVDFDAAGDTQMLERAAHSRVLDLRDALGHFDVRINDAVAMLEKRREIAASEIAVFVDCRGENRSAMLGRPLGIIGAASKKGDPEWGAGNDHFKKSSKTPAQFERGAKADPEILPDGKGINLERSNRRQEKGFRTPSACHFATSQAGSENP